MLACWPELADGAFERSWGGSTGISPAPCLSGGATGAGRSEDAQICFEDPFVIGEILSHLEALCDSQGAENHCHEDPRAPQPDVCWQAPPEQG
ncbi:MAG: hypothetical protein ACI8UP_003443 [Porticoccaceae bacterium]|jgi:hypothetical protein